MSISHFALDEVLDESQLEVQMIDDKKNNFKIVFMRKKIWDNC
jgi:hypothetical protein